MERNSKTWLLTDDRREVEKIPRSKTSTQRAKSNGRKITTNHKAARTRRPETANWSTTQQRIPTQTRRSEQWTVDSFWEVDRPTPVQHENRPGPLSASPGQELFAPMPMEEGEIESETDQNPSILEVPAINWARYVGVKSEKYVKMQHKKKQLRPRTSRKRNRMKFLNGFAAANEQNYQ